MAGVQIFQSILRDLVVEAAYLAWLNSNPKGYVLNCSDHPPEQHYPMLHNSACWTIGREAKHFSGASFKACSNNKETLMKWAVKNARVAQSVCRWCAQRTGLT